jgi:hypothetical protein
MVPTPETDVEGVFETVQEVIRVGDVLALLD